MARAAEALTGSPSRERRRALDADSTSVGLRILSDLLEAGLPVPRALSAFEEMAPVAWQPAVPSLRASVRTGAGLSRALEEMPVALAPIVIGIIRAGEASGDLASAMRRAADHAESEAATHDALRSALAYPTVVAIAGVGAIGVMVGAVLPRFARLLDGLGQSLPPLTRGVLAVSELLRAGALPTAMILVAATALFIRWRSTPEGRLAADRMMLNSPIVGGIHGSAATARFCGALAVLLESGVPVRTAIKQACPATGNAEMESRLHTVRERVAAGEGFARTLTDLDVATPTARRLIAAGEESGNLARMLQHAAKLERSSAERTTRAAIRLIEPLLIIGLAAVVGITAAAMLQAVYSIRPG